MNLLDDVSKVIGSDSFGWLGRAVGDTPEMADRAASAGLPALLGGVSSYGGTPSGATQIMNLIRGGRFDEPDAISRLSSSSGGPALLEQGKGFLGTIFGSKFDGLVGALSNNSGVKRSTMTNMLYGLAPIAFAVIGKKIRDGRLDAGGLSSMFRDQHASLSGLLPDSIANMVGLGTLAPHAYGKPLSEPIRREPYRAVAEKKQRTWWPWAALALAGALGLLLFFAGRRNEPHATVHRPAVTAPVVTPRRPAPAPAPHAQAPTMPVAAPEEHAQAPRPMPNQAQPAPRPAQQPVQRPAEHAALDVRSVSTDVHFATDSAALPASTPTLDRVANAARENPNVEIQLTGFTDANGPSEHNQQLSQNRADAVRNALVERGVPADRIETSAAAEARPIATNETADGRGANRRVEVRLVNNP